MHEESQPDEEQALENSIEKNAGPTALFRLSPPWTSGGHVHEGRACALPGVEPGRAGPSARCGPSPGPQPLFHTLPPGLQGAGPDVDVVVLLSEIVVDGGAVPAPAVIAGLQAKKPLGALLAPRHHVGEVLHHAAHVVLVNVRKEALVEMGLGTIFEGLTRGAGEGLDVSFAVECEDRNVWEGLFSEALPVRGRKKRSR